MISTKGQPMPSTPKTELVPFAKIKRDPALNCRAEGVNETTAAEYAEGITNGAKLPPVVVYFDGTVYRLADGFHRCRAHELAGKSEIECHVHKGGEREARLFSVGCNAAHGLRRTSADKRHAVTLLLLDPEWTKKSDRWIADTCGVSDPFVGKVRSEVLTVSTGPREGRDGKQQSATKPKKKKAKRFDSARAAKAARKVLEQLAKKWPAGESIDPLVAAAVEWANTLRANTAAKAVG